MANGVARQPVIDDPEDERPAPADPVQDGPEQAAPDADGEGPDLSVDAGPPEPEGTAGEEPPEDGPADPDVDDDPEGEEEPPPRPRTVRRRTRPQTTASYSSAGLLTGAVALVSLGVAAFAIFKLSTKPEKQTVYPPGTLGALIHPHPQDY